ncbi:MAG: NAD(P)/FAD-dependent oxidoreductase [Leucobacter sp.]
MSTVTECDLVVIGGGPAGLSAAARGAELGLSVCVIEENHQTGGKLRGQLHQENDGEWWIGWALAEELTERAKRAGVQIFTETVAWSVEPGWRVRTNSSRGGAAGEVRARAVLIATGAVEKPLPVEGWTLPGVFTIGGAQILTNTHRVKPGAKSVVVGVDPLSLTIARAMSLSGVDVDSIVLPPETVAGSDPQATLKRLGSLSKLAPYFYMRVGGVLMSVPGLAVIASRFLPKSLPLWGIPLRLKTRLVRIIGETAVTGVELEKVRPNGEPVPGSRHVVKTDSVCLSNGLLPLNDLSASLGLEFVTSETVGAKVPLHSATGKTQIEGLFLAGNTVGVESAKISLKQGEIVAGEITESLGARPFSSRDTELLELRQLRADSEFTFEPNIQQGQDEIEMYFNKRQDALQR